MAVLSKEDLIFPTTIVPPTIQTQEEQLQNMVQNVVGNAVTNASEQVNNIVELQIEAVPDETSTTAKPRIILNIKPKQ